MSLATQQIVQPSAELRLDIHPVLAASDVDAIPLFHLEL